MEMAFKVYMWNRFALALALGVVFFLLALCSLNTAASSQQEVASVPSQPGIVSVNGTQLIVQRRKPDNTLENPQPYTIKGVNWSPASPCTSQSQLPDEFAAWYENDIQLMAAIGVTTIRTFWDFGTGPTATQILDKLYESDIMVIMTVDRTIANSDTITTTVNAYKNHPAILAWAVGNEWDLNHYGTLTDTLQSAAFTEWAAQIVHGLDSNHPVASILSDIDRTSSQPLLPLPWFTSTISTQQIVNELVPSVDLWGLNIYRGATFGGLFGQWQQISTEPMFLAEFGTDSYDHRASNENQLVQAEFDVGLWKEINLNLSANWPDRPGLGGLVFEWNDEWWKNGSPCTHDTSGETHYGHPDFHNDEEWFGVVDIDRQPKRAYHRLRESFLSTRNITLTRQFTLSAFSSDYSQFFKNSAGFCRKSGGGASGRGLNFAVIDPNTGRIEDCRNFDGWYDNQAFVTMTDYISDSQSIPVGRIVLAAIADEGGFISPFGYTLPDCHSPRSDPRVEMGYQALESLGSTRIRNVGYWGSWAMITIKGQGVLAEAFHNPVYNLPYNGWCRMDSRVSTQVTATAPISIVVPLCAGDFSEDGTVSAVDLQALAAQWDQTAGSPYDLDGDGRVTVVDIMRVARAWGTCP